MAVCPLGPCDAVDRRIGACGQGPIASPPRARRGRARLPPHADRPSRGKQLGGLASDGQTRTVRGDARAGFGRLRRCLWWDRLDATYFLGYLLWNELTFPRLFLRSDVEWTQLDECSLRATFPSGFPTHCTEQLFRFDPDTGLLRRHDSTVDVFGSWARAVTIVVKHREWDGIMYACRRVATFGSGRGKRFNWPVLWSVEVHAWQLSGAALG
jgi:hypothetical protein